MSDVVIATGPDHREPGDRRRHGDVIPGILTWEEPPGNGRSTNGWQRLNHDAIAEILRAHPGRWARICNGSAGMAHAIRTGQFRSYRPSGSFDAVVRADQAYVRFVGEPTDSPATRLRQNAATSG